MIICTYNRAKLLSRAIESLLKQKEQDFEAIVVDDGSSDETHRLVGDYAAKHNWIRLVSHGQNEGVGAARNTGIKHSRGKFITFLDSDDEYLSNHLSERKRILESGLQIDFLHGGLRIVSVIRLFQTKIMLATISTFGIVQSAGHLSYLDACSTKSDTSRT